MTLREYAERLPHKLKLWSVPPGLSDPNPSEDYFLITRVVEGATSRPFLILAGLKQAGTEAAVYHLHADRD